MVNFAGLAEQLFAEFSSSYKASFGISTSTELVPILENNPCSLVHDSNNIIAFCNVVPEGLGDILKLPYAPWLANVWVHPDHRGKGLAKQVISEMLSKTCTTENSQIYLWTHTKELAHFYRSHFGFFTIAKLFLEIGPVYIMRFTCKKQENLMEL
jgi:predicted GNAT family N-acyltransferase